jgi:Bacterial archaeo-eukaryotic release factor family 10
MDKVQEQRLVRKQWAGRFVTEIASSERPNGSADSGKPETGRNPRRNPVLTMKQAESFSRLPEPLLTAYLNTGSGDPSHHLRVPACITWLKKEALSVARDLPQMEQGRFQVQLDRVQHFLSDRRPHEHGVVIFAGPGTWVLAPLQVSVISELRWGAPAVSQLVWLLSEHRPLCIVVVDRAGARFFRHHLRELSALEEKKFVIDISQWKKKELGHVTNPGIHKTYGSQRDVFEHRVEAQYAHLCPEIAKQAAQLCKSHGLTAIFLVGSSRLTGPIEAAIPPDLRPHVIDVKEDLAGMENSELAHRLEPAIANWERRHESELVAALLRSERGVITGVDETLAQLQRGRTHTLVVARDLDLGLKKCVGCGLADRSADPVCSSCGSPRQGTTLREILPNLLRSYHAKLDVVSGEAASRLTEAGGIGAWLREAKQAIAR